MEFRKRLFADSAGAAASNPFWCGLILELKPMLKNLLITSLFTILSSSGMLAQQPTWAENIFKIKMGRTHPALEARINQQKQAQEQATAERFSRLDKNRDGVISADEWKQNSGIPASIDTDGDGAISMKEWIAAPQTSNL
jgi:hypothetical protein